MDIHVLAKVHFLFESFTARVALEMLRQSVKVLLLDVPVEIGFTEKLFIAKEAVLLQVHDLFWMDSHHVSD